MKRARQGGGLVLELALASLGLAVFIAGATDIARIFQARGAVQAAVQEGLRCVYPLDGSCGSTGRTFGAPPAPILFDVWTGRLSQQYAIKREYATVAAQWSTEPLWRVPRETTRVESIALQEPQMTFAQHDVLYPVDAHAVYVLQTRGLPLVDGSDPLAPRFLDRRTRASTAPQITISLGGVRAATRVQPSAGAGGGPPPESAYYDSNLEIGEVSFRVADAWRSSESLGSALSVIARQGSRLECYESPLSVRDGRPVVDWSARGAPQACQYGRSAGDLLLQGGALKVPIMFRVSGSSSGTEAIDPGKINMSMRWSSPTAGSGSKRLGGRLLSRGSSGNFIVRGADWQDLTKSAEEAHRDAGRYVKEIESHGSLDLIPLDAEVRVSFFLSSADGERVEWQGGDMQLFFPTFELVKEVFPCGYSLNPKVCATKLDEVAVSYKALSDERPFTSRPTRGEGDRCRVEPPNPLHTDTRTALETIRAQVMAAGRAEPRKFWTPARGGSQCPSIATDHRCSADLQSEVLRGCSRKEWTREELLKGCGVTREVSPDAKLEARYSQPLGSGYLTVAECSDEPMPACAVPNREPAGRKVLSENDKSLSCAAREIQAPVAQEIGPYERNPCEETPFAAPIERYRAKYGVPPAVSVYVSTRAAPDLLTKEKPDTQCRVVEEVQVREEIPCGSKVASAAVEGCCREAQGDCRYQASTGNSAGSGGSSTQTLFNDAIMRTVETVQASFPRASYQESCPDGKAYCLQVSGALIDNNVRARMSAQVHVPFTLLRAVGWRGTTVSYEEARVLERARMASDDFVN